MVIVINSSISSAAFCSKFGKYLTAFELNMPEGLGFAALAKSDSKLYCEVALQNFLALGKTSDLALNTLITINYISVGVDHTEVHISEVTVSEDLIEAFFAANVLGN